ncbi:tetratricopeptide repeat protein [Winogradskyella wichelsiae]|uniref:tetratricopeptide repeat protein n=1 Tax=Winogradskyella wichelsiae TaxID=2697007 RepID=UPI0015C8D1BF|nr:tetratricopeptide repeat protein [Winogradskyella wichelsiae]
MKKSEKILIIIILSLFLGVLIFGHYFTTPLLISTSILSICYIFGGFYFLNYQNNKAKLKILAGISVGSALGVFTFTLWLPVSVFRKILVSINIIFSIILIGLWIYNKNNFNKELKYIFFRSITIAVITSFFTFSSVHFKTYRDFLLRMLRPDSSLSNNLLMFEKIDEYKKFMNLKAYDQAINKAKEAIVYGKKWRNYDTLYYQDFSGTYEFLSDAYIDYGDDFYNKNDFKNALNNYIKADSVLRHKEHKPKYVKSTESDIYWNRYNLLLTYNKLSDYDNYDSELDYLVDNYLKIKDTFDIDYHYILENASNNYYTRSYYSNAIDLNKASLIILNQDSINNINSFKSTYVRLIKNYLITDSTETAKTYLNKYGKITSNNDCRYLFYKTRILQKENIKEALDVAKKTCKCFEQENKPNSLFFSNLLLLKLELENSNYKNFEKQIKTTQDLISQINNKSYNQAFIDELLAYYNFIKGNYIESKKYYVKALNNPKDFEEVQKNSIELKIAQINDKLDISYDRNSLNLKIINFLSEYETNYSSTTTFHNDLGNINTGFNKKLSDSIFKVTIECHKNFGISKSSKIGIAYNGLATNQFHRKKYKKADSLYTIAIKKLDGFYGKQSNVNQLICYSNIIELKLKQKKYDQALDFLKKAQLTKTNCFNKEVTIYDAYLLNLEGDIIKENKKDIFLSTEKYNQAFEIAKNYFDNNHRFIVELKNKKITHYNNGYK